MDKYNIKHIFFDLDHTLWDFDRNSKLAFVRMFQNHKIDLDLNAFLKVYEPINFQYWKLYREEQISKLGLRRGRFEDAFKPFNITFSTKELDDLSQSYIDELPKDNYLFDGVTNLLSNLFKKYELHIITNGFEEVQHLKLQNSKINHFFKSVTTSEAVGVKKPNPLVFEHALDKAGAHASESVMVGDTFEADIIGAETLGMHTIFFNYRSEQIPNHYIAVDDIRQVEKYL